MRWAQRCVPNSPSERAQRMVASEGIVSICGADEHPAVTDSAAQELNQLKTCLVRPVHVLEHQHVEVVRRGELIPQLPEHRAARHLGQSTGVGQLAAELTGDVQQRRERLRRE